MIKSILIITALIVATSMHAQKKIKGNGTMTTITRTTSDYEGIKCAGPFDYILIAGTEGSLKIEGEENLLKYIITEVKDGNLVIKTEDQFNLYCSSNKNIKITIPFTDIDNVSLAGSGDLWNEDIIKADDFKTSLAGSGDMKLTIEATSTQSSIAGSGDMTIEGMTSNLDVSLAGSGNFHGFNLQANDAVVTVAGSGDIDVLVTERIKATVSGSGDIRYKGTPKIEEIKVAGSGRIESD